MKVGIQSTYSVHVRLICGWICLSHRMAFDASYSTFDMH